MAGLAVLEISGSPRARGRAYGEGLRDLIRARHEAWGRHVASLSGLRPDSFLERFLAETGFLATARSLTPDLLEEVHGIAEGCGLPAEAIFAAQCMDEEWWYLAARQRPHHCSSLGLLHPAGRGALLAQNMDLPAWMDGFQVLLRIRGAAPGTDLLVLTVAGMIGLCGMSSRGLGLVVNTLSQLTTSTAGLPVAFLGRKALEMPDQERAAAWLGSAPHASGQNYILADRHRLGDLECSADGAVPHRPGAGCVWHANHPLASRHFRRTAAGRTVAACNANSSARQAVLDERLGGSRGTLGAAEIKNLLADRSQPRHPISRRRSPRGTGGFTFASVIWGLGDRLTAEVAPGPPCSTNWQGFTLARTGRAVEPA